MSGIPLPFSSRLTLIDTDLILSVSIRVSRELNKRQLLPFYNSTSFILGTSVFIINQASRYITAQMANMMV